MELNGERNFDINTRLNFYCNQNFDHNRSFDCTHRINHNQRYDAYLRSNCNQSFDQIRSICFGCTLCFGWGRGPEFDANRGFVLIHEKGEVDRSQEERPSFRKSTRRLKETIGVNCTKLLKM